MINKISNITGALRRLSRLAAALALLAIPAAAAAQDYPNKVIRFIIPYAAGGAIDLTARLVAERLGPQLGQTVLIENRPGAGGRIGVEFVARAEPDGYTILYTAGSELPILHMRPSVPDEVRKLVPITTAVYTVAGIATRPDLGPKSMAELLTYIKANPGKLNYGGLGPGSTQNIYGEYFKQEGYNMVEIPFPGMVPMMTSLAGGQIDVAVTNLTAALPLARDGKLKVLAVSQSESFDGAPEIPPITNAMPNFPFPKPYYGFFGPPGLPRPIVSKLASEIGKVLAMPEVKARLATLSIGPMITTPEEFTAMIQETDKIYQKILKSANVKFE